MRCYCLVQVQTGFIVSIYTLVVILKKQHQAIAKTTVPNTIVFLPMKLPSSSSSSPHYFLASTFNSLLLLSVLFLVVICKTYESLKLPPNVSVPAVLVFGDSIMDTGNNNNNLATSARCNFPPYGKDFKGGIPTGRFCNGKVPSDYIAEELGIKEFLPAYLDPNLQPDELGTGVCFASGGAGYDPLTSQTAGAISLSGQLEMFKEYIVKLKEHVGENRTNFILSNSLFFIVLGTNDISNTYFLSHLRELQYDFPAYSDFIVNSASNFFKEIYELGARRIAVFSGPPVGCVPYHRTLSGGIERKCIQKYNNAVMLFNDKLLKEIHSLNQKLPDSRIAYLDVYNPLLDIIVNHQKYGYGVGDRGCCGTGTTEVALTCNNLDATCPNVLDYVFWDGFHPTESVYKKLVSNILQEYIYQFQ